MKPRDLLLLRIEQFLLPVMEEHGFRFARSKIYFRRRFGDFSHYVDFNASHQNEDNSCSFQTGWEIRSSLYRKWYRDKWGEDSPLGDRVLSIVDNDIPGWLACHAPSPPRRMTKLPIVHQLENTRGDADTMVMLQKAFENVGIPFLKRMSSWQAAAEHHAKYTGNAGHACDLLMIAGKQEKARRFADNQIRLLRSSSDPNDIRTVRELEVRRDKYFGACQVIDFQNSLRARQSATA